MRCLHTFDGPYLCSLFIFILILFHLLLIGPLLGLRLFNPRFELSDLFIVPRLHVEDHQPHLLDSLLEGLSLLPLLLEHILLKELLQLVHLIVKNFVPLSCSLSLFLILDLFLLLKLLVIGFSNLGQHRFIDGKYARHSKLFLKFLILLILLLESIEVHPNVIELS